MLFRSGKVVGGGFPIGVLGARNEIMDFLTPIGPVYNAGTFNGHPISMTAGLKTLQMLETENILGKIAATGNTIQNGLNDIIVDTGLGYQVQGVGPMFQIFFNQEPVWDMVGAKASDSDKFLIYFNHLRERGVYIPPSQFETCFISLAHDDEVVNYSLEKFEESLRKIKDDI